MKRYLVAVNARQYGAIGIFESREVEVVADNDQDARHLAIQLVIDRGGETRGCSVLKETVL